MVRHNMPVTHLPRALLACSPKEPRSQANYGFMDIIFLSSAGDNKIGILRRLEEAVVRDKLLVGYCGQKPSAYILGDTSS